MAQVIIASLWNLLRDPDRHPTQDELLDAARDAQAIIDQHPLREAEIEKTRNIIRQEQARLQILEEELIRVEEDLPEIIEEIHYRIEIPFDGWKPEPSRIEVHPVQQSVDLPIDSVNWRFCDASFSIDRETKTIWSENGDFFGEFEGSTKTLHLNRTGAQYLIAGANSVGLTNLCRMMNCMPRVSKTFLIDKINDLVKLQWYPGRFVDLTKCTLADLKKKLLAHQKMMGHKQAYLTNGDKRAALLKKFALVDEAKEELSDGKQSYTDQQKYGRWVDRINEMLIGKPIKARGFGGEEDPNHKNEWAYPQGYLPYTMTQDKDTGEWLSEKKNDTTWYKFEDIDKALEARNAYINAHNDSKHGIAFVLRYKGIQLRKNTKGIVYYNKNEPKNVSWELAIGFDRTY